MERDNVLLTDYLDTPDGHQLYYECWGSETGLPILFLHGGPGLGCSLEDKIYFDPERHFVIFLDQRGAGKSKPKQNYFWDTPDLLVNDLHLLLQTLKLKQVFLFGGSWGSTLATLFAIQYPDYVMGMFLRGFFPANQACINFFTKGGTASFFPEAWLKLISLVPKSEQHDPVLYYYKMLLSNEPEIQTQYALEWMLWVGAANFINFEREDLRSLMMEDDDILHRAIQVVYYSIHRFFLPDNYIYDHLEKLKGIPIYMVHGHYDFLCPPTYAYQMAQRLPLAELHMVDGGHIITQMAKTHFRIVVRKIEANFYL